MEENQNWNPNDPNPNNTLRSLQSREKSYLRFINRSNKTVEILWVNFVGKLIRYKLLTPDSYMDVDTYKTHPWVAQDVYTKDRMWMDRNFVYMPQTTRDYLNNPNFMMPVIPPELRKLVCVTNPLYSLKFACLLAVRNHFKTPDDVDQLELPLGLRNELKRLILLRNHLLVSMTVGIAGFPQ